MTIIEQRTMESIQELERKIPEMTLRDYFAGQALCGILTNIKEDFGDNPLEKITDICYNYADSMLKRRKR